MIQSKGKLKYFNSWLIVLCDESIVDYYRFIIEKYLGYSIQTPKWKAHISVIRGEKISQEKMELWREYDSKIIEFSYDNKIKNNKKYFWLTVKSNFLSQIRKELGLTVKPEFDFHLTIGNIPGRFFKLRHKFETIVKETNDKNQLIIDMEEMKSLFEFNDLGITREIYINQGLVPTLKYFSTVNNIDFSFLEGSVIFWRK